MHPPHVVQHDVHAVLHWHDERHHWSPHAHAEQLRVCAPARYSHVLPARS
jgi:hypothetical protein